MRRWTNTVMDVIVCSRISSHFCCSQDGNRSAQMAGGFWFPSPARKQKDFTPYTIKNLTGNGLKDGRGGKWPGTALQAGYSDQDDNMPHEEYVAWQRKCLTVMMRVLRNDGAIFYNHKWR
ncbi:MAG: hypothetical protein OXD38_06515, partial [Aestuariivita sp.]|nr:hypothetical protein [Aestuariivita sp.]